MKKPPAPESVREEAWNKYLDIFYKRPSLPVIDTGGAAYSDVMYTPVETRDEYNPERTNSGFFSISSQQKDIKRMAMNKKDKMRKELIKKRTKKDERSLSLSLETSSLKKETGRPLSVGLHPEFHLESPFSHLRRVSSAPSGRTFTGVHSFEDSCSDDEVVTAAQPIVIDVPVARDFPSNVESLRNLNKKITDDIDNKKNLFNKGRKEQGMFPVAPDGYLPNSVVVALYKELKKEEVFEDVWKPRELTEAQMKELEEFAKRVSFLKSN